MRLRRTLRHVIPSPVRRQAWRGYRYARDTWLKTIVGCQTAEKIAALTFDDGPNPASTPLILEILASYQVKATFFLLGRNVAAYPETARQIVQAGHATGNHTFTHLPLVDCSPAQVARELFQCQQVIWKATGILPEVMRPPFGVQSPASYLIARMMGFSIVNWSASGDDWQGDPAGAVAERVLADVQPGGIILLHDDVEPPAHQVGWQPADEPLRDRSPMVEALPMIIEPLQSQGYRFVTLQEMIRMAQLVRQSWFE